MLQATTHLADITPEIAISALVASEGNRRLAAERLSKQLQIHLFLRFLLMKNIHFR